MTIPAEHPLVYSVMTQLHTYLYCSKFQFTKMKELNESFQTEFDWMVDLKTVRYSILKYSCYLLCVCVLFVYYCFFNSASNQVNAGIYFIFHKSDSSFVFITLNASCTLSIIYLFTFTKESRVLLPLSKRQP